MYGLLASVPLFIWGYYSINAGLNSNEFGPLLGGSMILFVGLLLAVCSALSLIDKIFPIAVPASRPDITECNDHTRRNIENEFDYFNRLNTPDPNLIHPDDLKRIYAEYGSSKLPPQHEHQGLLYDRKV